MKKSKVAVAVASALGAAGAAQAADVAVTLTQAATGSANGTTFGVLSGTLTGTLNTSTSVVTMDAGTTSALYNITPTSSVFTHNHTNWSTGNGGYSATAYNCAEGTFGGGVGAHLCGNYNFGTDFIDQSSISYATVPGTRTIGGDDGIVGPLQQGSDYTTSIATTWDGSSITMWNALWAAGGGDETATATGGVRLTFAASAVPVPAAVWLFGSALGLLGWVRRRATA